MYFSHLYLWRNGWRCSRAERKLRTCTNRWPKEPRENGRCPRDLYSVRNTGQRTFDRQGAVAGLSLSPVLSRFLGSACPSKQEIQSLYDQDYFAQEYGPGIDPDSPEFEKRLSLEGHRVRFFKRTKRKGRVLDIGCGNSYFLTACRKEGYDVHGLDISDWAVQYATVKLGISVAAGEFGEVAFPPHSFDVITMWHFLEHTRDPRHVMMKAREWLKEDGILIIDVPNYEGTDAQKNWQNWVGWKLPYHLFHFTPATIKALASMYGFGLVKSKDYHSETIKAALRRTPVLRPFARLIARIYSGTSIAVLLKPSG